MLKLKIRNWGQTGYANIGIHRRLDSRVTIALAGSTKIATLPPDTEEWVVPDDQIPDRRYYYAVSFLDEAGKAISISTNFTYVKPSQIGPPVVGGAGTHYIQGDAEYAYYGEVDPAYAPTIDELLAVLPAEYVKRLPTDPVSLKWQKIIHFNQVYLLPTVQYVQLSVKGANMAGLLSLKADTKAEYPREKADVIEAIGGNQPQGTKRFVKGSYEYIINVPTVGYDVLVAMHVLTRSDGNYFFNYEGIPDPLLESLTNYAYNGKWKVVEGHTRYDTLNYEILIPCGLMLKVVEPIG